MARGQAGQVAGAREEGERLGSLAGTAALAASLVGAVFLVARAIANAVALVLTWGTDADAGE